ncbi:PF20097 family protein [uncultured Sphingomonas sp.]|uniref:PF20097 family protein n=1 Tax=uncultured Sphingomonas sp. TaxID=158754 RepID=UPI0025EF2855|nr:PF20097 family protein [uncultured Sphingomonas sp.]
MTEMPECLACRTPMQRGFVVDEGYGTRKVAQWIEGEPETSLWSGVKTTGRMQIEIESWRCPACGFVANYALT